MFDLTGKVALISGASRGLGAHAAKTLARAGAYVVLSARPGSLHEADRRVEELVALGHKASSAVLDLSDISQIKNQVALIMQKHGKIDILVNNAAVSIDKPFFDVDEDNWNLQLNTNLKGTFFLSQVVAAEMKQTDTISSIVNIAAINGSKVRKSCVPFSVSKAGVIHLTKLMAAELVDYGIKVNALSPGLFATESVTEYLENDVNAQDYINKIPMSRPGQLSDLEGALLLLASDASRYMTGSVIDIDGGFSSNIFMDVDVQHRS